MMQEPVRPFAIGSLILVGLLAGGAPGHGAQDAERSEFRSTSGRFKVRFPSPPTVSEENDKERNLVFHQFRTVGNDREFLVVYTDHPKSEFERLGTEGILTAARNNFGKGKASISDESRADCGAHPGRRFVVLGDDGGWTAVRICVAASREYILVAGSKRRTLPVSEANRFLDSFAVLPE